jgi:hypothetical protein
MRDPLDCAQVGDLLPEIAAGVAPGDVRAEALRHMAGCAECRAELAATAGVVDDILLLAPAHEPPPGFESRVLAALAPPPRRRPRRVALLAAAVVAAMTLGAGIAVATTWNATADDRRLAAQYRQTLAVADGRYLVAAKVTTQAGAETGHAFAYEGTPSWVFVTLTGVPIPGAYALHVVTDDGRDLATGTVCTVADGTGSCGTSVGVPVRAIQRLELRAPAAPPLVATF